MQITRKELAKRADRIYELLRSCNICPRRCGVNRLDYKTGYCGINKEIIISAFGPHFGEESVLVGYGGSGTIFFAGCNLKCIYCQNYEISHKRIGEKVDIEGLSKIMLKLQEMGCHNINLVTPTHVIAQILKALVLAVDKGLKLPLVYNSSGYDSVKTLRYLEGIIDIYMPDAKYIEPKVAKRYSDAYDYPLIMKETLKEMHRQVGDLIVDRNGLAKKGLLIRHLVLPNNTTDSYKVLNFIAKEISKDSYVNIMDQYRPCYKATDFKEISRRITYNEYDKVLEYAHNLGLHRGFE